MTASRSQKSGSSTIPALNSALSHPGSCIAIVPLYSERLKSADLLKSKPILVLLLVQIYRTEFCHRNIKKYLRTSEFWDIICLPKSFLWLSTFYRVELPFLYLLCSSFLIVFHSSKLHCQPLHYLHYNHCQEWEAWKASTNIFLKQPLLCFVSCCDLTYQI